MSRATGSRGMHVIPWEQTQIDHTVNGPLDYLAAGASWCWWGPSVRVDGAQGTLPLGLAEGQAELHARAARGVRRFLHIDAIRGTSAGATPELWDDPLLSDRGFMLTDGYRAYDATLLAGGRLVLFADGLPPRERELWVVRLYGAPSLPAPDSAAGVICFTPGTRIAAPGGARAVEALRSGDRIFTRDDGPQEVIWTGQCDYSAARLRMRPDLRPIRFRAGALGAARPEGELLVSPSHRILLRGGAARQLYNTPEVLVAARDLVNDRSIVVDNRAAGIRYIHLMLARHQIVIANGVEAESFHPAHADISGLAGDQRNALREAFPQLDDGPEFYGEPARRCLDTPEAEILRYGAGLSH